MKYLKSFNESYNKNDVDIIRQIFSEETYHSAIALTHVMSKIQDDKLRLGLMVDLMMKRKEYGIDDSVIKEVIEDFDLENGLEAHDYYIDTLNDTPVLKFHGLITDGEISENPELVKFVKSLSDDEFEEIVQFCIENEIYEIIPFIKSLR